jgi:hypothetical protein
VSADPTTGRVAVITVTDRDSVVAAAECVQQELGGADILVNNAGVMLTAPFASDRNEEADGRAPKPSALAYRRSLSSPTQLTVASSVGRHSRTLAHTGAASPVKSRKQHTEVVDRKWTIKLTRDEALILSDYLSRWDEAENYSLPMDYAERAAFVRLSGYLESADDGSIFGRTYVEEIAAAKARLVEKFGKLE